MHSRGRHRKQGGSCSTPACLRMRLYSQAGDFCDLNMSHLATSNQFWWHGPHAPHDSVFPVSQTPSSSQHCLLHTRSHMFSHCETRSQLCAGSSRSYFSHIYFLPARCSLLILLCSASLLPKEKESVYTVKIIAMI